MNINTRNRWTYGLGAIGRDNVYCLVTTYLIFYLTDIVQVSAKTLWWVTVIILLIRILDIPRDPILGMVVDNTRGKWGRFKPWIAIGTVTTGIFTVLLYTKYPVPELFFIIIFAFFYLLWDLSFSINDVAYLALMPTLSVEQKERERITSVQRTCSYFGTYITMACIIPVTAAFGSITGSMTDGWFYFAIMASIAMFLTQCITILGVKETGLVDVQYRRTSLKDIFLIIVKNDQLVSIIITILLLNVGNITVAGLGIYYFKYINGNAELYPVFSIIIGIAQMAIMFFLPKIREKISRASFFKASILFTIGGYIILFVTPPRLFGLVCLAGILIFSGNASSLLVAWMYLVDSIDYGHWKMKKRNDSVTISVSSFANKMGSALANGIIGTVVIFSGIRDTALDMNSTSSRGIIIKLAMTVFPALCMLAGYFVYIQKYKIDDIFHEKILRDLLKSGELRR
jgi:melibiose permease/lactose/raffinose/galactose permease